MTLIRLDSSCQDPPLDQAADMHRRRSPQQQPAPAAAAGTLLSGKPIENPALIRIMPLARAVIYPVTTLKTPYLSPDDIRRFKISISPLDLSGEVSQGQEQYIKPLPPRKISELLNITQPWADGVGTADFVYSDRPSINSNYTDASFVWQCIRSHLTHDGTGSPNFVSLIEDYTRWRMFNNEHRWLHRRCDPGLEWQAEAYIRYCLPGTDTLDPSKPHVTCFLGDNVPLRQEQLSTSEVTSLLWLSSHTGAQMEYMHHDIIPVTLISGSGRQLRILQGIIRFSTQTIQVRKSEILDFQRGVRYGKNWQKFLSVLSWVIGEPVGKTVAT